jgi:1-acyl-sn-glycerol-3-phosphate acyltransferase
MVRRIIVALLKLSMRVYFRRVEVAGRENVPLDTPVIFVLNHPNALVDPAFLLSLAPRRISFLAKSTLFRMPVISYFVRAMDSLPVYRQQDQGEDVTRNREMFVAARKLLASGGTIAICPEGVSHDEPRLRPIKTGAARLALGAVGSQEVFDLKIVPTGLYYTSKTKFRSGVLLYFGQPLDVPPVDLEADGDPPRAEVRELSQRIEDALRAVMLDAEHEDALQTIRQAERIFSSGADDVSDESLTNELQLQQRFVKGYQVLREIAPERLRRLEVRMDRFEAELSEVGVDPDELSPPTSTGAVFKHAVSRVCFFLLLGLPAAIGTVVHYPAYRLGGYLATRFSKDDDDMVSTIKIMSAMLLFPLTWLVFAAISYKLAGWWLVLAALIVIPVTGYVAILFFEGFDRFMGGVRALTFFLIRRRFFVRLLAERKAIRTEILALGEETANVSR